MAIVLEELTLPAQSSEPDSPTPLAEAVPSPLEVAGDSFRAEDRAEEWPEEVREPETEADFFDSAPIGQHIVASDGTIVRANAIEHELLGYAPEEFVGHAITEFHLDSAVAEQMLADLFSGMRIHHREARMRAKDGSVKYVLISGSALSAAEPQVHCFMRDITEHKHAEEKLREINRNKDEFLATLAHELRNPLAPIRSAVEILNLHQPPPEMQWALDVIDRQMRQMSRLIDDLLDIGRISGNKLELHIERVELSDVLRVAFETSQPLIEGAGHKFFVSQPPEPIFISGDLIRLAQIISNLLNNASKYTPEGGTIWFTAERRGDMAVLVVRDNGMGIALETLPHIFDLFTQGHHTVGARRGGLGIGLTLVKRLVEMHGGTIDAHSAGAGKGATFVVKLPIVTDPSQRLYRPVYDRERAASGSSLRVLVVDDNLDAAATFETMLTMAGNTVDVAHDGLEAIDVARTFVPQVILLDLDMPRLNGYEAAKKIRELPGGSDMVIIAVTGFGLPSDRLRSKEAGFNHHLVKPVDPATLLQLLTSIERFGGKLPEHLVN